MFNDNAEEAVNFYVSIFPDSKIESVSYYTESVPGPLGQVLTIAFQLFGQSFVALNGGPSNTFTPAVSLWSTARPKKRSTAIGKAFRRRRGGSMRMGYGSVWAILAGDSNHHGPAADGSVNGRPGHAGDDADGQVR